MSKTVDQIQSNIAAYVDEDQDTANISTDDYALRLNFMNEAMQEFQEAKDWSVLYSEYNVLVSTSTGNASIALPSNFKKLATYPTITSSDGTTNEFPETSPLAAGQYSDTKKRVEILGNNSSGFVLRVFGTTLSSGASVKVPYYSTVSSLASPANIPEIPNPDFLVKRTIAYLLESRDDTKFVQVKADADRILANMIDRDDVFSVASDEARVKTIEETKYNFRIGDW